MSMSIGPASGNYAGWMLGLRCWLSGTQVLRTEPHLVAALLPQEQAEPARREMALLCPLPAEERSGGILALGEKRDGTPFTSQELAVCAELARQLAAIGRMIRLRQQRDRHLEVARLRDQALRQLEDAVIASTRQTLTAWERRAAPLEIRLLGPLQVVRDGQLVAEAAWGTERAKVLLSYLLWKGPAGATREEISMALWPDRPVGETANVFHVTLYRLRRVLEPGLRRGCASSYSAPVPVSGATATPRGRGSEQKKIPIVSSYEPIKISASLSDNQPILGATVTVDVQPPSAAAALIRVSEWIEVNGDTLPDPERVAEIKASTVAAASSMTLYDDGAHGDGQANDGVYANTLLAPVLAMRAHMCSL